MSGAPVTKKNPLKELVDKKTEELNNILGKKKKEMPSLPKLPALPKPSLPKIALPQLPKKSKDTPAPPQTQVSGAPVTDDDQKKNLPVPVSTIDLKKVLGRKM